MDAALPGRGDIHAPPALKDLEAIWANCDIVRARCRGSFSRIAGSCKPPLVNNSGFCLTSSSTFSKAFLCLSRFALQGRGAIGCECPSSTWQNVHMAATRHPASVRTKAHGRQCPAAWPQDPTENQVEAVMSWAAGAAATASTARGGAPTLNRGDEGCGAQGPARFVRARMARHRPRRPRHDIAEDILGAACVSRSAVEARELLRESPAVAAGFRVRRGGMSSRMSPTSKKVFFSMMLLGGIAR